MEEESKVLLLSQTRRTNHKSEVLALSKPTQVYCGVDNFKHAQKQMLDALSPKNPSAIDEFRSSINTLRNGTEGTINCSFDKDGQSEGHNQEIEVIDDFESNWLIREEWAGG